MTAHGKRIVSSVVLMVLIGAAIGGLLKGVRAVFAFREALDAKIATLEIQLAALGNAVETLAGENSEVALSLEEIKKRGDVRTKSQDELLTDAVARVTPSVVSIVVSKDVPKLVVEYMNPFGNDPFFRDFDFKVPVYRQKGTERQRIGAGTGFIVTRNGYILTNRHVVSDPSATYTALLSDGSQKEGRIIFRDPENDLALMKIEGRVKPVPLGDSGSLKLGQTVIAIGNALGEYSNSVSVGIISGLDRALEARDGNKLVRLSGVIQTDAAINPGNSGGPLLTLSGEVIGINVATVIGGSNISFAIPIDVAKRVIEII